MEENKLLILEEQFKAYKEQTDKVISELKTKIIDQDKRLFEIEKSKEKTDYQFEQIMKTLDTLNKETIPNLTKEIEELKNKPVKRYDQIITTCISAIVGAIVGAVASLIAKK